MNRNQKRIPNQTVFTIEQFEEIVRQSLQQFKLEEANRVRGAALSTSVKEELGLIFETNNKDDLRQYKKNVHRYDDGPWTTTKTINKEFILKLKQWKVGTNSIVNTLYIRKYSIISLSSYRNIRIIITSP
ncbi:hypothetical protein BCV71DRAFT_189656 [Rhizopus microsporus]|uniref:Uncharacterized protein n=1 Tax=Rhizopus microsporus TaxID=58291 RepID=A0A1X0RMD5_RHIZD|nr:hypothetical protein BCV71DRAFT_189656 [Rhizopus microsporus]